uniref:Ankyrin repeat and MYND domain-containing protein 1 n=1 Tax=Phallusia mammillata TaxID=59560 RepID=A0A6F9D5U4_9ASCI|nr:ankyrin repeat and MYND domain-containing protein 1 [Phallusia mammillata]
MSIALIEQAGLGNFRQVYSILKSGLVDANVMDCKGSGALLEAAINCHHKVVNLLLDCGANVNQVTDEAVSALSACHVFYYPIDHFKYNIAEKYVQNHRRSEEKEKRGRPRSPAIDLLMRNRRRSSSSGERKRRRSSQSPDRASPDSLMSRRKTIASPERLRIAGREKLTPSPVNMGETEAIETCKSDLKIKKVFRDIMSAKSQGRSSEAKSFNFDPAVDDVSSVDAKSQHTSKDDLTFESNVNMVEYNLQVSEHLIERTATLLSHNLRAVSGISTRDGTAIRLGTAAALAVWKSEHKQLESMMHLLMKRGADPNIGSVPFPCLFFAVKAGDVDAVRVLLQHGASTNCRLSDKLGGLTPLHIASGIRCSEGVPIVELLLHASANPNTPAHDEDISRATGTGGSESGGSEKLVNQFKWMETGTQWVTQGLKFVEESGRTPLHIACDRDDNYREAREIANLLLDNGANPDVIWNGYSPLALAIASGNDFCIDELLHFGADGSLPLTRGIGSALCVASNPKHEHRRTPEGRIRVIDKLVNAGANILVPVTYGSKELTGTVVDYAHWMFFRDSRIAHTPYHALSVKERETYNARKRLLSHLGSLLRHAAVLVERERLKQETHYGIKSQSPSRDGRFLYTGAGADIAVTSNLSTPQTYSNQEAHGLSWGNTAVSRVSFVRPGYHEQTDDRSAGVKSAMDSSREAKETSKSGKKKKRLQSGPIRKPLFRYCYDCGRSVGVRLTSCSRCHEVFYCSRACKLKAWEERHKDECLRIKVYREQSPLPTPSEIAALFADRQLDETIERANLKTTSIVDTILNQHLTVAEENALILSRKPMFGSRGTTNRWTRSRGRDSSSRRAKKAASGRSGRTTHTSNTKSHSSPTRQSMAKVGSKTRRKVGKEVEFGTTGLTLHELGITENYSFN